MKFIFLLSVFLLNACASHEEYASECRDFPQRTVVNNQPVNGHALACSNDDGQWQVKTFKDSAGNDLPAPSQVLYPQPALIRTAPQTAFTATQVVAAMPMPHITFYEQ